MGGDAPGLSPRRWPARLVPMQRPRVCASLSPARVTSPRRRDCRVLFVAGVSVTAPLSTSIYISGARCPMASGEPIRWQIRCQLGGSCLETVAASLPPQFKFRTWRRRPGRSSGPARPAGPGLPAPRTAPPRPPRKGAAPRPAAPRSSRLSIDRSIGGVTGLGQGGAGGGGRPAPCPRPFTDAKDFSGFLGWVFFFSPVRISACVWGEKRSYARAPTRASAGGQVPLRSPDRGTPGAPARAARTKARAHARTHARSSHRNRSPAAFRGSHCGNSISDKTNLLRACNGATRSVQKNNRLKGGGGEEKPRGR